MGTNLTLPPDPQHAVLNRIYPWENYNETIVLQWLYLQAKQTGFSGSFEDFKLKYGTSIDVNQYEGSYEVTPMINVAQILRTQSCILSDNIVVKEIPYYETSNTAGGYTVIIG